MTSTRSSLASDSVSVSACSRCSSSSTATASKPPLPIASRTASTLSRETCAVPSSRYSTPSRSTHSCGCPCSQAGASVTVPPQQVLVGVDAAVAKERPDAAHVLAAAQVDLGHQHLLGGVRQGQELALRAQHVAVAPEILARGAQQGGLVPEPVARQHRQPVGHGVATVAEDPGIALAVLLGLVVDR